MENVNTELSGRNPAYVTWIQTIGLLLFVISRFFLKDVGWLLTLSGVLIIGSYLLKIYFDWKAGRKKAARNRLLFLVMLLLLMLIVPLFIDGNR